MLDLFLSVAYDFYYENLIHKRTINYIPEEQKMQAVSKKQKQQPNALELRNARTQSLKYPGKVLCIERQENMPQNLIVISDSANNRLVIINEETMECISTVGNSRVGLVDGSYNEVQFHYPQGLCHVYREGTHFVYICDTKNHALRELNLKTQEVLTVIGTGEKGNDKEGNKAAESQKLSSPQDIVAVNRDTLVFSQAGTH